MSEGWKSFSIKGQLLAAAPSVIKAWTGTQPIKGEWVLRYWGHPMSSWLPKPLQPNGSVGHQYKFCGSDADVVARYGEIVAALKKKVPTLSLHGPAPDDPKLVALLAKKMAGVSDANGNGMTIQLERATASLRAEAAISGDNDNPVVACVVETDAGPALGAEMSGPVYATVDNGDVFLVACTKGEAKRTLPAVLERTGVTERKRGKLKLGKELAIGSVREAGKIHATLACKPGTFEILEGEGDDLGYLRLRSV